MRRHGIPQRDASTTTRMANRDSEAWRLGREKIKATRLANWQDSDYRARVIENMRAAQPQRVAARQAGRAARGGSW